MVRRLAATAVLLVVSLVLAGCPKDPYRASIQGSDDVASSVHTVIDITTSYYNGNLVNDQEKKVVADGLRVITEGNIAFRGCVIAAHDANSVGKSRYLACADEFTARVTSFDPVSFGFKNPKAQAELRNYLKAVKTAIDGIQLAVQAAKGGK